MVNDAGANLMLILSLSGIVVAISLAFLPRGKAQSWLLLIVTLVPVWFFLGSTIAILCRHGGNVSGLLFALSFISLSLPLWLALTLLPFHVTSRLRNKTGGN